MVRRIRSKTGSVLCNPLECDEAPLYGFLYLSLMKNHRNCKPIVMHFRYLNLEKECLTLDSELWDPRSSLSHVDAIGAVPFKVVGVMRTPQQFHLSISWKGLRG